MSNAFDKASLVMLPHAYEEGKVYSLKPTDRSGDFTYSRGTDTATRVGEDGYIKKEYENLLLQSNSFITSPWSLTTGATLTSGISDPDGGTNAWQLNFDGTANARIQQQVSVANNSVYTFSFYGRVSSGTKDISVGAVGSLTTKTLTTEWQRIEFFGVTTSTITFPQIRTKDTSVYSIEIYQAQFNPGLVAYPYLETTTAPVYGGLTDDMPRLDYSGGATCPSLLLEPSRTNLIGYSEYFNTSATDWRSEGSNGVTITTNETTSPEGLVNASKLQGGGASNDRLQWNFSTSNTKAIYSVFVKGAGDAVRFSIFNSRSGDRLNYDVDTSGNFTLNSVTGITNHDIKNYGNGWYRIWGEFTTDAALANYFQIYPDITGSGAIYLYGAQIEEGSYPTSYIPTYGSSQTREADSFTDKVYNLGTSFSLFIEADNIDANSANAFFMRIGSVNPQLYISANRSEKELVFYTSDGTSYMNGTGSKIAVSYDGSTWTWAYDGVSDTKSAGANDVVFDKIKIATNGSAGGGLPKLSIKNFILYDEVLTSSELEALTAL